MNYSPGIAFHNVKALLPTACQKMNTFSSEVLRTRGGRIGSGMGALLEALWGYMMNQALSENGHDMEIAWFANNQYNDFACLEKTAAWDEKNRAGELFRIEAKSMNVGADESKAHFDVLQSELHEYDSLLILVWEWKNINSNYFSPQIIDAFFDITLPIVFLRDELHIARGGSFVDANSCPDDCSPNDCLHHGEPLNAAGKRERIGGPETTRPSNKVSYAANFGGLVRMLKTDNEMARSIFRNIRKNSEAADEYISFIHRIFPSEEANQYTTNELRIVAKSLGIDFAKLSKTDLLFELRKKPNYMQALRNQLSQ
jgi:hypothetical protein